jgi:hypothetical protein
MQARAGLPARRWRLERARPIARGKSRRGWRPGRRAHLLGEQVDAQLLADERGDLYASVLHVQHLLQRQRARRLARLRAAARRARRRDRSAGSPFSPSRPCSHWLARAPGPLAEAHKICAPRSHTAGCPTAGSVVCRRRSRRLPSTPPPCGQGNTSAGRAPRKPRAAASASLRATLCPPAWTRAARPPGGARLQPGDEVLVLHALDDLLGGLLGQAHLLAHLRQKVRLLLGQRRAAADRLARARARARVGPPFTPAPGAGCMHESRRMRHRAVLRQREMLPGCTAVSPGSATAPQLTLIPLSFPLRPACLRCGRCPGG